MLEFVKFLSELEQPLTLTGSTVRDYPRQTDMLSPMPDTMPHSSGKAMSIGSSPQDLRVRLHVHKSSILIQIQGLTAGRI